MPTCAGTVLGLGLPLVRKAHEASFLGQLEFPEEADSTCCTGEPRRSDAARNTGSLAEWPWAQEPALGSDMGRRYNTEEPWQKPEAELGWGTARDRVSTTPRPAGRALRARRPGQEGGQVACGLAATPGLTNTGVTPLLLPADTEAAAGPGAGGGGLLWGPPD